MKEVKGTGPVSPLDVTSPSWGGACNNGTRLRACTCVIRSTAISKWSTDPQYLEVKAPFCKLWLLQAEYKLP